MHLSGVVLKVLEIWRRLGHWCDTFQRYTFDLFNAGDLIFNGDLGVISSFAFPESSNWTLAFI